MSYFILGDVHSAYKALKQCLERSNFNKKEDTLITLGDIIDSYENVVEAKETVEELLTIKNRIDIRGNHCFWFLEFIDYKVAHPAWLQQGGDMTIKSYNAYKEEIPQEHKQFFNNQHYQYIDDKNRLFIHGGYNWKKPFSETSNQDKMWDRKAFNAACQWELHALLHPTEPKTYFKEFREVFIGHTQTMSVDWRMKKDTKPLHVSNMWNLDTGSGSNGKLTIMNVDTKEYWQSDLILDLYPKKK